MSGTTQLQHGIEVSLIHNYAGDGVAVQNV